MRPRGNALPPTAGRRASLWHQITNERGGTRGRRVCCLEQLSSPSLSPASSRTHTRVTRLYGEPKGHCLSPFGFPS